MKIDPEKFALAYITGFAGKVGGADAAILQYQKAYEAAEELNRKLNHTKNSAN